MREPSLSDAFSYIATRIANGDWTIVRWLRPSLAIMIVARVTWARHRAHQRAVIVMSIVKRWIEALGMPAHALPMKRRLEAVDVLGRGLVGDRQLVLMVPVQMRIQMEEKPVDPRVLEAMDRLAAEWQDKLSPARRRRYRQMRGLDTPESAGEVDKTSS